MADGITAPAQSEARQRLSHAIKQVKASMASHAAILEPERRLRDTIRKADVTAAQAASHRAAEDQRLAAWMLAEVGPKPAPSVELLKAERAAAEAERDARAAQAALVDCERRGTNAAEVTRVLVEQRDAVLFEVIAEEIDRVGDIVAERWNAAVIVQAELRALADAALNLANAREASTTVKGGAAGIVDRVNRVVGAARKADATGSVEACMRFIDRLKGDAGTTLEVSA